MIIKSIELENIRSYKKELIEFDTGINFLSGDIGSGKSSILQAIEFALFGFKKGDLEGFQLLRKGEKKASIKLILQNLKDSSQIEIYRGLKKSKTTDTISQDTGYVIENNNLIELTPQELNAAIFNILNFPKEFLTKDKNLVYRFTIYTPQEQLKEIIFEKSDKRLEVIRKIFGIDKYKQLQEAISIYSSKIRGDKKIFEVKIEPKNKLLDEIKNLKTEIKEEENKLKEISKKEKETKLNIEKYKSAIEKRDILLEKIRNNLIILEKKKSQLEEYEIQIKSLKENIKKKQDKLKELSKSNLEDKIKLIKDNLKQKEKKEINLSKTKLDNKAQLDKFDSIQNQREILQKNKIDLDLKQKNYLELEGSFDYMLTKCRIKDLENYISKDNSLIKKLLKIETELKDGELIFTKENFEIENLKNQIKEKDKILKNINKINKCDNCHQDVSDDHKKDIKIKIEKEINNLNLDLEKKENNLKLIQKEIKEKTKKVLDLSKLKDDLLIKEEKLNNLKQKEKEENTLQEKLKKLKLELNGIKELELKIEENNLQLKNFEKIKKEQDDVIESELKIGRDISNLKLELNKIESSLKEKNNLELDLKNLDKELNEKLKDSKSKNSILDKLKDNKEKEDKLKQERNKLNSNLDKLNENQRLISNKLSSIQTQIENKNKLVDKNNKEIGDINLIESKFKKIIEDESFLNNKVSVISSNIEKAAFTKYYCEFNESFESLFRDLIEDNDIDVRLDENFSPIIEQNGYDTEIKNLSGGEKSSVAIAYRLGLKKIIENNLESNQKLSLLILDEPTDGFSNNQVDRLGNILKETSLKQVILVSHDEKIESIADNVLRIEKINHKSSIN